MLSHKVKRKFQQLACTKIPTGDPNCLPYVRDAKQIYCKIVQATDGSTGDSDDDYEDFGETGKTKAERNEDESGDEDENIDLSNNDEDDGDIGLLNPAALLPLLGKTISGNNSFPADEVERAPARGGSHSGTESAWGGGGGSDIASTQGESRSDTAST